MRKVLGDSGSAPSNDPYEEEDVGKRFELLLLKDKMAINLQENDTDLFTQVVLPAKKV